MREQQLSDAAEDFAKETFLQMHGNYNDAVYNIGFDNNKPIACTSSSDNITNFDKSKVTLQW